MADGSGCTCYNNFGVECYATCASNIHNYEVRQKHGVCTVTVTCSPGNVVLGCGSRVVATSANFEKWPTFAVNATDSCQCYDYFGVTCYALCGRLT